MHEVVARRVLWAVAVPAAAVALALVLVVTRWFIPASVPVDASLFLAQWLPACRPEPLEQTRYLLAITVVPLVLWGGAVYVHRRGKQGAGPAGWDAAPVRLWAGSVQCLVCGFAAAMILCDHAGSRPLPPPTRLLLSALVYGVFFCAWRFVPAPRFDRGKRPGGAPAAGFPGWVRPCRRAGPWLLACALTAVELLPSVVRADRPFGVHPGTAYHFPFYLGEFAAVVNGHTPLVDFFPQYQNGLAYLLYPVFRVVGLNPFTFSVVVVLLSGCMLLMLFHVLRLVTGGGWAGLTLYLPLLWLSFTPILADNDGRYQARWNTFTHFAVGPFRFFGPCLALVFLAAYLLRPGRTRLLLLFFVAGAAAVNNLDFGLPALGAALVVTLCTTEDGPLPHWRTALRTLAGGGLGAGAAVVVFLLLTGLRSGRLPEWRMVASYQRAFAVNGFGMLPMPAFGLHWVLYLTFMAAIGRGLFDGGAPRLRRGLCLYSGVFGTGAMMYYVGRSHPQVLVMIFPAWALSFVLLAWLGLEDVQARMRAHGFLRALTPAAVLLGAGHVSMLATFAERPNVVQQVGRLTAPCAEARPGKPPLADTAALAACIRAHAAPGEKVGIIAPYGHLVAGETGVVNVFPFACPRSLIVRSQLLRASRALQEGHVRRVFASGLSPDVAWELARLGFRQEAGDRFLWTRRDTAEPAEPRGASSGEVYRVSNVRLREADCPGAVRPLR